MTDVIRARPIGESQWVYDKIENRKEYIDEPENDLIWEIEDTKMTLKEMSELPEFTGW